MLILMGYNRDKVRSDEIPSELLNAAKARRDELVMQVAEVDEQIAEKGSSAC